MYSALLLIIIVVAVMGAIAFFVLGTLRPWEGLFGGLPKIPNLIPKVPDVDLGLVTDVGKLGIGKLESPFKGADGTHPEYAPKTIGVFDMVETFFTPPDERIAQIDRRFEEYRQAQAEAYVELVNKADVAHDIDKAIEVVGSKPVGVSIVGGQIMTTKEAEVKLPVFEETISRWSKTASRHLSGR